ncbi:MAG: LUD domain-containing protein [Bacteroidales bacterium]
MNSVSSDSARNSILTKLRHTPARHEGKQYSPVSSVDDYFVQVSSGKLITTFSENLIQLSGECIMCDSEKEAFEALSGIVSSHTVYVAQPYVQQLCERYSQSYDLQEACAENCVYSLTTCDALAARTASVIFSSNTIQSRTLISAPEVHIVIAYEKQLVPDLPQALQNIPARDSSQLTVVTGPSRTADIEKTLVLGAHGPKRLCVIIIKDDA